MEHYVFDVVLKCVLLTNVQTSGWATQNVERSEILVHTNDILQVLFGENAGKQCVAMSPTAIIYHHID